MSDGERCDESDLAAGAFSSWLTDMQAALRGERGSEVPCDGCTACCTASQFIHIAPDETETLSRIPAGLLWPAPRLPDGHVVLGYDERGHCPMLVDNRCSIYEHRPRTCRTYDCRMFPAAGAAVDADGDDDKVLIARRARRWQFSYADAGDRVQHEAVRAAAAFLEEHRDVLPAGAVRTATQLAVLAIEIQGMFVGRDTDTGETAAVEPEPDQVRVEVMRRMSAR